MLSMNFVLLASKRKILARLIHKAYLFYFNIGVNGEAYFAFLYSFIISIVDLNPIHLNDLINRYDNDVL